MVNTSGTGKLIAHTKSQHPSYDTLSSFRPMRIRKSTWKDRDISEVSNVSVLCTTDAYLGVEIGEEERQKEEENVGKLRIKLATRQPPVDKCRTYSFKQVYPAANAIVWL